jgi:hypothetical protein
MTATMNLTETTDHPFDPAGSILAKGWHPDPHQAHDLRYHDGAAWTEHVTHFGPVPCTGCHPACH